MIFGGKAYRPSAKVLLVFLDSGPSEGSLVSLSDFGGVGGSLGVPGLAAVIFSMGSCCASTSEAIARSLYLRRFAGTEGLKARSKILNPQPQSTYMTASEPSTV